MQNSYSSDRAAAAEEASSCKSLLGKRSNADVSDSAKKPKVSEADVVAKAETFLQDAKDVVHLLLEAKKQCRLVENNSDHLTRRIDEYARENLLLISRLDIIGDQRDSYKRQIDSLKAEIRELKATNESLTFQNSVLRHAAGRYEQQRDRSNAIIQTLLQDLMQFKKLSQRVIHSTINSMSNDQVPESWMWTRGYYKDMSNTILDVCFNNLRQTGLSACAAVGFDQNRFLHACRERAISVESWQNYYDEAIQEAELLRNEGNFQEANLVLQHAEPMIRYIEEYENELQNNLPDEIRDIFQQQNHEDAIEISSDSASEDDNDSASDSNSDDDNNSASDSNSDNDNNSASDDDSASNNDSESDDEVVFIR